MSKNQHILVWRLSSMGDVAMMVPVLQQLIKSYPFVKLTVVSKPFFKPVFTRIPNLTFVGADVKNQHKGVLGLYRLFKTLQPLEITLVADLHNVLRSKIIRFFFNCTKTRTAYINKGRKEKKKLTKASRKKIEQLKTTHQRYADVFASLGFPLDLKPLERVKISNLKNHIFPVEEKKGLWIGIAPFAAFKGKEYPLKLMKQVVKELVKIPCKIVLFGGGDQEAKKLEKLTKQLPNTVSLAGKLPFKKELAIISNLDLMISMDSGNGHLAAMFGVEILTLWGVTHPYAGFTPYGQPKENQLLPDLKKYPLLPCSIYGNKVYKGYENVMESLLPKVIVKRVSKILEKKSLYKAL